MTTALVQLVISQNGSFPIHTQGTKSCRTGTASNAEQGHEEGTKPTQWPYHTKLKPKNGTKRLTNTRGKDGVPLNSSNGGGGGGRMLTLVMEWVSMRSGSGSDRRRPQPRSGFKSGRKEGRKEGRQAGRQAGRRRRRRGGACLGGPLRRLCPNRVVVALAFWNHSSPHCCQPFRCWGGGCTIGGRF